jgi:hypothetical protein
MADIYVLSYLYSLWVPYSHTRFDHAPVAQEFKIISAESAVAMASKLSHGSHPVMTGSLEQIVF